MARYSDDMPNWFIDAKELWKRLIEVRQSNKELDISYTVNLGINQAIGELNRLPAADVAEVVRCKDCKYGRLDITDDYGWHECQYEGGIWNKGDHFCSYGERKNNDKN